LAYAKHERFGSSIDLLLIVQEENGLVVVYLFGLHILISQDKNGLAVVYRCWIHAIGNPREVYQQCLEREFAARGIPFDSKRELKIFYKGEPIEKTYIPDFVCYDKIIVEIKAVDALSAEHRSQVMNYLKLTRFKLGLLVNFGSYPKAAVEHWAG